MKLYIDMIAFYLQKAGGITSVWKELLIRMMKDEMHVVLILQDSECHNIYFKQIMSLNPEVIYEKGSKIYINRYLPIRCHLESGSRFLSTYYRVSLDKTILQYSIVHDFTYEHYMKGIKRVVHSLQKKWAVKYANNLVCVSENTKKDLMLYYPWVRNEDIYVIYNGVSKIYQPCSSIGTVKELGRYNKNPFLLYVGSRATYKRFDVAVKIAGNRGYGLVIVGGGMLNKKESELLMHEMGDHYIHISGISDERLNLIYNKAFALIYPSEYEGFGMPIVEAQRAGCPVIACKGSSVSEVMGKKGMLLSKGEVSEAERLIDNLENKEYRAMIIAEGYKNAERFSWDKTYDEYKKLLYGIL